jgi:hypothetical protein
VLESDCVPRSMRRCYRLLAAVATATAFTLPRCRHHDSTPRLLQAQPPDSEQQRRGIDPVVGKAIVEKSGFFAAAIVLAVLFEKYIT